MSRRRWKMSRVQRILAVAAALSLVLVGEGQGDPEPPDPLSGLLPGRATGTILSRWVAPYVQETQVMVGDGWATDIRWFRPDGSVLRELHDPPPQGKGPSEAEPWTVPGIRRTWSVRLRELPDAQDRTLVRGEDDSTLVHSWVDGASIHADVYKDGRLLTHVGPYPRYAKRRDFVLGDDGSMAVLALKEPGSSSVRVVVFAPGGKPSFDADAGGEAMIASVAPDGRGVVLQGNGERYAETEFTWISKAGTSRTLQLEPNPWLSRWVPGTAREVVTYGLAGKNPRFRLVDWESGETIWDVADPVEGVSHREVGIAIERNMVLLAGIQCRVIDGEGFWRRTCEALDVGTGAVVARWHSVDTGPPGMSVPGFMRIEGQLWLVADDAFAPFPIEDIGRKVGGWQ